MIATAAAAAVEHVGLPECMYALSQATIYLALAPKSKAFGYDSPHDHPGHIGPQTVAPDEIAGMSFYEPDEMEAGQRARLEEIRRLRARD